MITSVIFPTQLHLYDSIHERSTKLDTLSIAELQALKNDLKGIIRLWSSRWIDGKKSGKKKKKLQINSKGMSTACEEIICKHGQLKLAITRHMLQQLKEDIELRANIQSHMVSPRLFIGDTSSIQSLFLQISDEHCHSGEVISEVVRRGNRWRRLYPLRTIRNAGRNLVGEYIRKVDGELSLRDYQISGRGT